MEARHRATCRRGHPRTEGSIESNGGCRECRKERQRKYQADETAKRRARLAQLPAPIGLCGQGHDQAVHGRYNQQGGRYCAECRKRGSEGIPCFVADMPPLPALLPERTTPVCGSFPMVADPDNDPAPRLILMGPWQGPESRR